MKKLLLLLLLWLVSPLFLKAQMVSGSFSYPVDSMNRITYQEIVNIKSSKTELYKKAKKWFIRDFNSGKDVIQLDDALAGEIIGKGFYIEETLHQSEGELRNYKNNIWYTVAIKVKDGKYRIIINDLQIEYHNVNDKEPLENILIKMTPMGSNDGEGLVFWLGPNSKIKKQIANLKEFMLAKDDF
ncbi:MAG: hypothetical protein JWP44_2638 [Mucilaginibacter sp.]|nr:hypothetical protein [Mucilaginibacter sp.]